jgi:hypothetical protein
LPRVGQSYCLYLENGKVFRTGEVTEVGKSHFRTTNSVYEIEVVEETAVGSPPGRPKSSPRKTPSDVP